MAGMSESWRSRRFEKQADGSWKRVDGGAQPSHNVVSSSVSRRQIAIMLYWGAAMFMLGFAVAKVLS